MSKLISIGLSNYVPQFFTGTSLLYICSEVFQKLENRLLSTYQSTFCVRIFWKVQTLLKLQGANLLESFCSDPLPVPILISIWWTCHDFNPQSLMTVLKMSSYFCDFNTFASLRRKIFQTIYIWKSLNGYHTSCLSLYLEIAFIWTFDYWLGFKIITW